jgi:hypothetical protein
VISIDDKIRAALNFIGAERARLDAEREPLLAVVRAREAVEQALAIVDGGLPERALLDIADMIAAKLGGVRQAPAESTDDTLPPSMMPTVGTPVIRHDTHRPFRRDRGTVTKIVGATAVVQMDDARDGRVVTPLERFWHEWRLITEATS